jgi:hypothetical protein
MTDRDAAALADVAPARREPRAADGGSRTAATNSDPADEDRNGDDEPAGRVTMLALARHAHVLGWWREFHDVVPDWFRIYLALEPAADLIRTYETKFIPGLLQTEDYARDIIRLGNENASVAEIDRRVELRMRRQQILHRPDATTLWAIIDEEALHHPHVSAATMRGQAEHLLRTGRRPNIAVQVMSAGPATPDGHAAAGGPITILRFPEWELPDIVYLEQLAGGLYPHEPNDIHHYRQVLDRLGIEAKTAPRPPASLTGFSPIPDSRFICALSAGLLSCGATIPDGNVTAQRSPHRLEAHREQRRLEVPLE